ncbi:MAG: LysR family transcriptional regulator [Oscillospiraceae bacterium]
MTLLQLEYCVEAGRVLSISQAARNELISQSSMSQSILTLEQELGQKIFTRGKSGVALTQFGERFILQAQKILHNVDNLELMAKKMDTENVPSLSVEGPWLDVSSTVFVKLFSEHIKKQDYSSKTRLRYRTNRKQGILQDVLDEKCDVGIINVMGQALNDLVSYCKKRGLKFIPLGTFPAAISISVCSDLHGSKAKSLSAKQLDGRMMIIESQRNSIFASENTELLNMFPNSETIHMLNPYSMRFQEIIDAFWIILDHRAVFEQLGVVLQEKMFSLKEPKMDFIYGYVIKESTVMPKAGALFIAELGRLCDACQGQGVNESE